MPTLNIYLTFDGNCEEAFEFYRSVFGGEFQAISRFSEMPPDPNFTVPDHSKDKIMHVSLPISPVSTLMGSDHFSGHGPGFNEGNNFSISVHTDDIERADEIFAKLSLEGSITMPMADTFWGSYFGSLTDKFGIQWMISSDIKK